MDIFDMKTDQREEVLARSFIELAIKNVSECVHHSCKTVDSFMDKSLDLHEFANYESLVGSDIKSNLTKDNVDCIDPESGVTPLMTACFHGNLKDVKRLVNLGADVNFKCSAMNESGLKYSNITPIYTAAVRRHYDIVRYLAVKGADLNQKCIPLGYTPLHRAVCQRDLRLVRLLVEDLHAKVNIANSEGDDPILTAVKMKCNQTLCALLKAKNVNCSVPDGIEKITALHYASYLGDLTMVSTLIKNGKAELNAKMVGGFTPLDLAVYKKHKKVVEFLRKVGAQHNVRNGRWQSYSESVAGGLIPLKAAISKGVDVDAKLPNGGTALHYNVKKQNWEACKFLLNNGANVNYKDYSENTPMHVAANFERSDYLKLLVDHGANVNVVNAAGETPLHVAAKGGHYAAASFLISHGADLNAIQHEGGSPIVSAAMKGHAKIVQLLLDNGVDPNKKFRIETIDCSVLHLSCHYSAHKPEVIRALVNAGANVNDCIERECGDLGVLNILPSTEFEYVESLQILIEAGAFIDTKVKPDTTILFKKSQTTLEGGDSPLASIKATDNQRAIKLFSNTLELFKAVRKNDLQRAKEFLSLGGLVNCCSVRYETPLIYASWKGYHPIVKFLLENGALLSLGSVKKSSALHYAAKFNHKLVVVELLRAGAKYDAVCCNKTALQLAEEANNSEIVSLLKCLAPDPTQDGPLQDTDVDRKILEKYLEESSDTVLV